MQLFILRYLTCKSGKYTLAFVALLRKIKTWSRQEPGACVGEGVGAREHDDALGEGLPPHHRLQAPVSLLQLSVLVPQLSVFNFKRI